MIVSPRQYSFEEAIHAAEGQIIEARKASIVVVGQSEENREAARQLLRTHTSSQRFQIIGSSFENLDTVLYLAPEVVVFDPTEVQDGLAELLDRFRSTSPGSLLVAYLSEQSSSLARSCIRLGVRAIVPRRIGSIQLVTAIRVALNNGVYVDRTMRDCLLPPRATIEPFCQDRLSEREETILRRISSGHSHKQIAAELDISPKTVDTYRSRGLRKLGITKRAELVRHALQKGWLQQ